MAGRSERQDALALFLLTKLGVLGRSDRAQATMVSAWLTELYLDQVRGSREGGEGGGGGGQATMVSAWLTELYLDQVRGSREG